MERVDPLMPGSTATTKTTEKSSLHLISSKAGIGGWVGLHFLELLKLFYVVFFLSLRQMYIIVFIITTNSIEFMYKVYIFMNFAAFFLKTS